MTAIFKRITLRSSVSLSVVLLFPAAALFAATFHVNPSGQDGNSGTQTAPWKTIGKAARTLGPGDTVLVHAGTYREQVLPQQSGQPGRPIVYAAFPGDSAVIDGEGIGLLGRGSGGITGLGLFCVDGLQHITVRGLTVRNSSNTGFCVLNASHITLEGNHTYNTFSSGIISSEFGVNHHIYAIGNDVELACNDGAQECISFAKTDSFLIARNHIHHSGPGSAGGEGIDVKFGSTNGAVRDNIVHHISRQGLYVDSWSIPVRNIELSGNVVYRCQFGFAIATEVPGGALDNISFHHNVIYDCERTGIMVSQWGSQNLLRANVSITNNTVYNNGWRRVADGGPPNGGLLFESANLRNFTVKNNLFANNCSFQIATKLDLDESEVDISYNLLDGYNENPPQKSPGVKFDAGTGTTVLDGLHAASGNAGFADAGHADFRLLAASAAIDAGDPAAEWYDPDGSRNDIGAFYFQSVPSSARHPLRRTLAPAASAVLLPALAGPVGLLLRMPGAPPVDLRGAAHTFSRSPNRWATRLTPPHADAQGQSSTMSNEGLRQTVP